MRQQGIKHLKNNPTKIVETCCFQWQLWEIQRKRAIIEKINAAISGFPIPSAMQNLTRITRNPEVMGGKPCIRGMRITVGTIVGLMASGHSTNDILKAYPYLEEADIYEALAYAAWRAEENIESNARTS